MCLCAYVKKKTFMFLSKEKTYVPLSNLNVQSDSY